LKFVNNYAITDYVLCFVCAHSCLCRPRTVVFIMLNCYLV